MYYTKDEVLDYIGEEDVKFVRLAFCDAFGNQRNISIMASELERAMKDGVSFDASAIWDFEGVDRSDLLLFPDPATLADLPWRPNHGRVIRLYSDIKYPDGTPFECDGRYILRSMVKKAADAGITVNFGSEYEFYLFLNDENGMPTRIPHDRAGYMYIAPDDRGENIRREICLSLEEMGIRPERSHHEMGPGQHEVDFRYSDPLSAADNATTFKSAVKTISAAAGLHACFQPKPLENEAGSGMHINISAASQGGADVRAMFMAGIFAHIKEMTLFLNPTEESYLRLGRMKAPGYITWSPENRSQLIRIPAADNSDRKRIELRSPDAGANPYIAYALLIAAGLEGIENEMEPPDAVNLDLFGAPENVTDRLDKIPGSIEEAREAAAGSDFIKKILPVGILESYGIDTNNR